MREDKREQEWTAERAVEYANLAARIERAVFSVDGVVTKAEADRIDALRCILGLCELSDCGAKLIHNPPREAWIGNVYCTAGHEQTVNLKGEK